MRKILETLLGIIIVVAIVLAGAQEPDGSMDIEWTVACLSVVAVAGVILRIITRHPKQKGHIPYYD